MIIFVKNYQYLLLTLGLLLVSFSCMEPRPGTIYMTGTPEEQEEVLDLYSRLSTHDGSWEGRYIIINRITEILHQNHEPEKLNLFLSNYVESNQDDPFNAFYLYLIAQNYFELGAYPFAEHYFNRIHANYKDVYARGFSIHYLCLTNLIQLTDDPEKRIVYMKELLSRFPTQIDQGKIYYQLGNGYEEIGQWDLAFQAYNRFMAFPETEIPEVADAYGEIREKIEFYKHKDMYWVVEDLDQLVRLIKTQLYRGNVTGLKRYMSEIGFFTNSWDHDENIPAPDIMKKHLGVFMETAVYYSRELDVDSNDKEAFLRTWNWSHRIRRWYLYFEKIDFPAVPEIHGKWQWKGIYLGEKAYSGDMRTD